MIFQQTFHLPKCLYYFLSLSLSPSFYLYSDCGTLFYTHNCVHQLLSSGR